MLRVGVIPSGEDFSNTTLVEIPAKIFPLYLLSTDSQPMSSPVESIGDSKRNKRRLLTSDANE